MGKILSFAFRGDASERIIRDLPLHHKVILDSDVSSIDTFLEDLLMVQPDQILGLGEYPAETDKVLIEARCYNTFQNEKISEDGPSMLPIPFFIPPGKNLKVSDTMGNSFHNLISYKIMEKKATGELHAAYTFLHIPKNLSHLALNLQWG